MIYYTDKLLVELKNMDSAFYSTSSFFSFAISPSRRNVYVNGEFFYLSFPWLHFNIFCGPWGNGKTACVFGCFSKDLEGSVLWKIPLPNIFRDNSICLGETGFDCETFFDKKSTSEFFVKIFFSSRFSYNIDLFTMQKILEWQRETKEDKNWIPEDGFFLNAKSEL